jgi:hypothetical protein
MKFGFDNGLKGVGLDRTVVLDHAGKAMATTTIGQAIQQLKVDHRFADFLERAPQLRS